MFCPKCGTPNPDGAKFCKGCGQPLPQQASVPVQSVGGTPQPLNSVTDAGTKAATHRLKVGLPIAIVVAAVAIVAVAAIATGGFGLMGPAVKSSVNDYSWEELQTISDKIAKASSDDEGLKIAEKYHLCTADGKLDGTQTKDVTLTNGTQAAVQIAGFRHDDRSDGSGKAGITFIFKDAIAEQPMNSSDTNSGGWQSSQMRSWLASSGMGLLPDELRKEIVSVRKLTNNTGETENASSVTSTDDSLWLFSYNELTNDYSGWSSDYLNEYGAIYKAEGSTYQLFTDASDADSMRTKYYQGQSCLWWERSPYPDSSVLFESVYTVGNPIYNDRASISIGVVPGFCI